MLKIKQLANHHLVKGSFIVLIGNSIVSFLNYLYHLIAGRLLLPDQYGLLESLIALTYFILVFTQAFSFSVINLIARAKKSLIFSLVKQLENRALKLSFIFWLLFLILFPFLKEFLHLPNFLIFLLFSLQVFFCFLPAVYLSTLQARLKFFSFSLVGISQSLSKDIFAFVLIFIGWQVKGALGGLIISGLIGLLIGQKLVKKYWKRKSEKQNTKLTNHFWRYSFLSLVTNLALTSIYSTDILLVRHYFSSYQSGIYSAVSVLGKMIFFAATSILLVAFPLFVKYKDDYKKLSQTFGLCFLFLLIICLVGLFVFKLWPGAIVKLLYGQGYAEAISFLPYFAVFISLFAVLTLLVQFLLALESSLASWLAGIVALSQIFLILNRHLNLKMIISNSLISTAFGLLLGPFFVIKVINEKKQ